MKKRIGYSSNESNVLGFKVGRLIVESSMDENIVSEIVDDKYDLVRVRLSSSNEKAIFSLKRLGFPFYFSGSIRKYKTEISSLPHGDFFYPDLVYEAYDGSQNELLYNLLEGTWGTYPLGYYKTPYLNELVNKKLELDCVFEFYKKHNLPSNNSNNGIMFMKHKGNYVGFFALNVIDDRLESHIGGIVEPYRTSNYFVDMQEYIRRFCIDKGLKYFCFGARNENGRVQSIFQEFGYTPFATDNIFHITPFLSLNNSSTQTIHLTFKSDVNEIRGQIVDHVSKQMPKNWTCNMIKMNALHNAINQTLSLEITSIESNEQASLSIYKVLSNNDKLLSWGYIEGLYLV